MLALSCTFQLFLLFQRGGGSGGGAAAVMATEQQRASRNKGIRGRSLSSSGVCTAAPKTGCFQSSTIKFEADINDGNLEWKWTRDATSPIVSIDDGDTAILCVYDGAAVTQTETQAPSNSNSLVFQLATTVDVNNPRSKLEVKEQGADLSMLGSINPSAAISQVQVPSDGTCYGATFSITLRNAPTFNIPGLCEPGTCLFNQAKAQVLLNEMTALYNKKYGAQGPLDMTFFSNALAATEIQNLVVTKNLTDLDTAAIASAMYVLGWYGGSLFQRDGFSRDPPPGPINPNFNLLGFALALFGTGITTSLNGSSSNVSAFLTSPRRGGILDQGSGLVALVDDFGYNTGYAFAVLRDNATTFNPPINKLTCSGGVNYTNYFPFPLPRKAPLFDCFFEPSFLESRSIIRPLFAEYAQAGNVNVAALSSALQPSALETERSRLEQTGFFVWALNNPALINLVLEDQNYRESLWDVNNAFLEVIEAAAALSAGALARNDIQGLGRKAVLASTVLKGWLIAYQFGLSAPGQLVNDPTTDPRVLPLFDFGTTPIEI